MTWDLPSLSPSYQVRPLTEPDIPEALALCQGNPLFYHHCPPEATEESIRADMKSLPPRTAPEDKVYLGYFRQGKLVALMDLIQNYPEPGAAFIGFFMVDASRQGRGLGSQIIGSLCSYLESQGCPFIRLGWVQGNQQSEHFWHKNGFQETGVLSRQEAYTIICAQRNLTHS